MEELRAYNPTWKDRIAGLLMGDERASPERRRFVEGLLGSSGLGSTGVSVSDFTPLGIPLAAQEALHEGDYRGAAMAALPMAGAPVRGAAAAGKAAAKEGKQALERGQQLFDGFTLRPDAPGAATADALSQTEKRISTRFPTAAKATENPLTDQLSIGLEEMRRSPTFADNMNLIPQYPGYAHLAGRPPEEIAQGYIRQSADNLLHLYDNAPEIMRQRSPHWYDGANEFAGALADRYGIPRQSASGAIAALSPQMDWFKNASLAERTGDIIFGPAASRKMTPDMEAYFRSAPTLNGNPATSEFFKEIQGKSFTELNDPRQQALWVRLFDEAHNPRAYRTMTPEGLLGDFARTNSGKPENVSWGSFNEVGKAVQSYLSGGDMNVLSPLMGEKHKVRSFYNNIELPNDKRFMDVTADTHQVAAAQLRPLSGNTPAVSHNLGSSLAKPMQPEGYKAARNSSVDGVQGTYGLVADATRLAANERNMLGRQGQSSTLEPVRELFTDVFKRSPDANKVDDVWKAYDRGEISIDQARRTIFDIAGGIGKPAWAESNSGLLTPARGSTYR